MDPVVPMKNRKGIMALRNTCHPFTGFDVTDERGTGGRVSLKMDRSGAGGLAIIISPPLATVGESSDEQASSVRV